MEVAFKVWRAFVIASDVPNSQIKTTRDMFNAVGPGVSTALKTSLILMALPGVGQCPGINIRWGEPFELLTGVYHPRALTTMTPSTSVQI